MLKKVGIIFLENNEYEKIKLFNVIYKNTIISIYFSY